MAVVVGPSNYVEPYGGIPKSAPLHVDANGGLVLGAGAVAALLGSVRIQDGTGAFLGTVSNGDPGDAAAHNNGLKVDASLQGYNGATWDRLRTVPGNGITPPSGSLSVVPALTDSANIRRLLDAAVLGDGNDGHVLPVEPVLLNNVSHDRARSASAANLGATSGLGAALVSEPGEWVLSHFPATNVQATATRAGVAGTRHILKAISARLAGDVGAAFVRQTIQVRDGASSVGPILWQTAIVLPGASQDAKPLDISGLHLVGTPGNAMTVEFSAAAGANTAEVVNASGYDAT